MRLTKRYDDAILFTLDKHRTQERKGSGAPYVTHLLSVSALVGEYGGDEEQMIAALLHDCMEDQGVRAEELEERFGARVAAIVIGCTDTTETPKPPWRARKEAYVAGLAGKSPEQKLVVAADKLHNALSIVRDVLHPGVGMQVWERFSVPRSESLWYYRAVARALAEGWSHPIVDELHSVVARLDHDPGQTVG